MIPDTLLATLEVAVPLRILQLRLMTPHQRWNTMRAWRADASEAIAHRGDILQYGTKRRGATAAVFNDLARGLAVLAHAPGGVLFAGRHWCIEHPYGKQATSLTDLSCTAGDYQPPEPRPAGRKVETVATKGVL